MFAAQLRAGGECVVKMKVAGVVDGGDSCIDGGELG